MPLEPGLVTGFVYLFEFEVVQEFWHMHLQRELKEGGR